MTAAELLAALREAGCEPAVDGADLVLTADPPDAVAVRLEALHTGVLALLTGKRWYGCDPATGRTLALDPADLIPPTVELLSLGGADLWERLHPVARLDLPELFTASEVVRSPRIGARVEQTTTFDLPGHTA